MKRIEFEAKGYKRIANIEGKYLYMPNTKKKTLYYCSCTGKTEKTATPFFYTNGIIECPECKKRLTITKTNDQIVEEAKEQRENIQLYYAMYGSNTGPLYALDQQIDRSEWNKIKEHMFYYRGCEEEEDNPIYGDDYRGWATRCPEKVEKILGVKKENTVAYREEQSRIKTEKRAEENKILNDKLKIIKNAFEDAEYPDSKQDSTGGDRYEHPRYPHNIHGGGEWWVIQKYEKRVPHGAIENGGYIWHIINNGADGDDWSRNNVDTGGAGAIGARIEFNPITAKLIKEVGKKE